MEKIAFLIFTSLYSQIVLSQAVIDYKVKNSANVKDRTMMLDIFRANLYEQYKQEFTFVVTHFKVSQNYAWFMGDAQRKDGKEVELDDDMGDCCHAEALFKKSNEKWYIVEGAAFSYDVWYDRIWERYPAAPRSIFPNY